MITVPMASDGFCWNDRIFTTKGGSGNHLVHWSRFIDENMGAQGMLWLVVRPEQF